MLENKKASIVSKCSDKSLKGIKADMNCLEIENLNPKLMKL